jgi:hypothetical protein
MKNRPFRLIASAAFALALVTLSGTGRARAEDSSGPAEAAPGAAAPTAAATTPPPVAASVSAPIRASEATLHQGAIQIDGDVVAGLSKGSAFKPVQVVPNLYYGVSNELTAGFAHNTSADILQAASVKGGRGLCLSGASNGCDHFYNGFDLDALYSLLRSSAVDLAAHGGVDFILQPFLLSLRLGVKVKAAAGPLVVVFDPSLNVGLDRRDQNKEYLQVPARIGLVILSRLNIGVSAALDGQLSGFGDNYTVPLGAGAIFAINDAVDVRAQFAFDKLAGKGGSADFRTLSIGAAYRM